MPTYELLLAAAIIFLHGTYAATESLAFHGELPPMFQLAGNATSFRMVRRGGKVLKLRHSEMGKHFSPAYVWNGRTNDLDAFNEHTFTSGLLVLRRGDILAETYMRGANERTLFTSFSTGKSLTSLLVGMAIEDGRIKSVNDSLISYLPGLTGSAFDGASIRDALQMLTGVPFESGAYDFNDASDPFARLNRDSLIEHRYRFVEGANRLKRQTAPGAKFIYSTMNSALLGWLVENVTQKRLSRYMEERFWKPAGMESDAAWEIDGPADIGREMAGGGFFATLRDYGRIGLLMAQKGKLNGVQLLSPEWIAASTTPDRPAIQYGHLHSGDPFGYGYQWWLAGKGRFLAIGIYGQMIFIAPDAGVVIVKLSIWPEPWNQELAVETYAFFDSVLEAVAAMTSDGREQN